MTTGTGTPRSCADGVTANAEKRPRESPGEQQIDKRTKTVDYSNDNLLPANKIELIQLVHSAVENITTTANSSRLNKADIANIGILGQRIIAAVATLELHLAEAEMERTRAEARCATMKCALMEKCAPISAPTGNYSAGPEGNIISFAHAVRTGRTTSQVLPADKGPVMAIYPAVGHEETLKSADDTKNALKSYIDPAKINVQIQAVRKVGNAGVVIQTTNKDSAVRLKEALPPSLRATEPQQRAPQVAFLNMEGDPNPDETIVALHEQNFADDPDWPLAKIQKNMKLIFKRWRSGHSCSTCVFECSPALRENLVTRGRVYIGWQVVNIEDHITVTCCTKCQQYGHPERYCRAKETTCGKCGKEGHRRETCQEIQERCATCTRFGRKEATDHSTAARKCPARHHAEQRLLESTNYGS